MRLLSRGLAFGVAGMLTLWMSVDPRTPIWVWPAGLIVITLVAIIEFQDLRDRTWLCGRVGRAEYRFRLTRPDQFRQTDAMLVELDLGLRQIMLRHLPGQSIVVQLPEVSAGFRRELRKQFETKSAETAETTAAIPVPVPLQPPTFRMETELPPLRVTCENCSLPAETLSAALVEGVVRQVCSTCQPQLVTVEQS